VRYKETHGRFHHALKVIDDVCTGCTHCMTVCPTQAIRVRDGKAVIMEERCVDCGNCCKACPVSAIVVEQDDFQKIFNFPVRIALVPAVLVGQFPSNISTGEIFGGLKQLGFTHVFEIESVVGLVQEGYNRFINARKDLKPAISTFCPAILRLIQVRFPSLVGNLVRVKPPSDVAAVYYRTRMEKEGYLPSEIGIYYVTPCAAKIASIKSPVGEEASPVNGVINMEFLYNKLLHLIMNGEVVQQERPDSKPLSSRGILWSLTRGESSNQAGRCLAVDGIRNVTEFLERLEDLEESHFDFLELRACDESCAGGVLISGNRFLTVERLNRRSRQVSAGEEVNYLGEYNDDLYELDEIRSRQALALDMDSEVAIAKMDKVGELLKVLPGIDCAACGSPTCRSLAEDIVQEDAELSRCIFLQEIYIRDGRLTVQEADKVNMSIWGKNRKYMSQKK
jgi:iron only hydrogenase large subunit-like protein